MLASMCNILQHNSIFPIQVIPLLKASILAVSLLIVFVDWLFNLIWLSNCVIESSSNEIRCGSFSTCIGSFDPTWSCWSRLFVNFGLLLFCRFRSEERMLPEGSGRISSLSKTCSSRFSDSRFSFCNALNAISKYVSLCLSCSNWLS